MWFVVTWAAALLRLAHRRTGNSVIYIAVYSLLCSVFSLLAVVAVDDSFWSVCSVSYVVILGVYTCLSILVFV